MRVRKPSFSRLAIRTLRWYQRDVSPGRAASCRYYPTCSEYSVQAFERYGAVRGSAKTVWRLIRCNPLSHGGYDPPVPDDASEHPDEDSLSTEGQAQAFHVKHHAGRVPS